MKKKAVTLRIDTDSTAMISRDVITTFLLPDFVDQALRMVFEGLTP